MIVFYIHIYGKHSFSDWRCSVNMMSYGKTPQNVQISLSSWARSIFDFAKSIFFIKINIFLFKFGLSLHSHMKVFSEVFTNQSKFSFYMYITLSDALIVRIGIAKICHEHVDMVFKLHCCKLYRSFEYVLKMI